MLTKTCTSCAIDLPLTSFHKRTKSPDGHQSRCKDCNCRQRNEYYRSARGRAKNELSGRQARYRHGERLYRYLESHPCVHCGESDPTVLEFDHLDGVDKTSNISTLVRRGVSWTKLEAEIAKCRVLCANCHRRRTAKQFNWYGFLSTPKEL